MKLETPGVRVFQQRTVPAGSRLAGWALLAQTLAIPAPLRRPSCVSKQHVHGGYREEEAWNIFDKRYWPGETFADHLTFALRHEHIDLLILKRVFEAVIQGEVEDLVRSARTGISARRAWYLHEIL